MLNSPMVQNLQNCPSQSYPHTYNGAFSIVCWKIDCFALCTNKKQTHPPALSIVHLFTIFHHTFKNINKPLPFTVWEEKDETLVFHRLLTNPITSRNSDSVIKTPQQRLLTEFCSRHTGQEFAGSHSHIQDTWQVIVEMG